MRVEAWLVDGWDFERDEVLGSGVMLDFVPHAVAVTALLIRGWLLSLTEYDGLIVFVTREGDRIAGPFHVRSGAISPAKIASP